MKQSKEHPNSSYLSQALKREPLSPSLVQSVSQEQMPPPLSFQPLDTFWPKKGGHSVQTSKLAGKPFPPLPSNPVNCLFPSLKLGCPPSFGPDLSTKNFDNLPQPLKLCSYKENSIFKENENKFVNLKSGSQNKELPVPITPSKKKSLVSRDFSFRKDPLQTTVCGSNKTELADFSGLYSSNFKTQETSPNGEKSLLTLTSRQILFQSQSQPQHTPLAKVTIESSLFPKEKKTSLSPFPYFNSLKKENPLSSPFLNENKPLVFNTPKISESPKIKPRNVKPFISPIYQINRKQERPLQQSPFLGSLFDQNCQFSEPLRLKTSNEQTTPNSFGISKDIEAFLNMNSQGNLVKDKSEVEIQSQILNSQHISFGKTTETLSSNIREIFGSKSDLGSLIKNKIEKQAQDSVNEFYQQDSSSLKKSESNTIYWKEENNKRKDSNFSEIVPQGTCSLFSKNLSYLSKMKPNRIRKNVVKDKSLSKSMFFGKKYIAKRNKEDFDFVSKNDQIKLNKRKKIHFREIKFMNSKKSDRISFFKTLNEKVLDRRQKNSKRIFLKEKRSFYIKRANYMRTFNPSLFKKEEFTSECSLSINSSKNKSRTLKDFFPVMPQKTQGFDFIQNEAKRLQDTRGKMSLNKFDFFKSQALEQDDKKSWSNLRTKGKASVPKLEIPDLESNRVKEEIEQDRKKSLDLNNLKEWGSFQNMSLHKTIEPENVLKLQTQDLKLTPAKFPSMQSFLAIETPKLEMEQNIADDSKDLKSMSKKTYCLGKYSIKSPYHLNNMEEILNNKNLKFIKKTKMMEKIKKEIQRQDYLRRETNSVILHGALEETSLDASPKLSRNKAEARRRRPDAEDIQSNPMKCNCKLTQCLKRYCSCFSAGRICGADCECQECCNQENNPKREEKLKKLKPKTGEDQEKKMTKKGGCKCSSSGCTKKYCECYRNGVYCMESCRCINCKNARSLSPEL